MTRVVIAPDSFKGSLSAREVGDVVARAIREVAPHVDVRSVPLADGGDGTADVLASSLGGTAQRQVVTHPLGDRSVEAAWLRLEDAPEHGPDAVVEMASACGLALVPPERRDPLRTTTAGAGELIAAAIEAGARRIWLTLGGSATVDGGTGAATALGWRFLDTGGRPVAQGGGGLEHIAHVEPPPEPLEAEVTALYDVDNPLLGPGGAARIFGPQKGAGPDEVERLEAGLAHLAERIRADLGIEVAGLVGGGAAGGLGAGAVAFLGATLARGIDRICDAVGFAEALDGTDWILTGEGRLDLQSLDGKVVSGVLSRARPAGVRVAALAGRIALEAPALEAAGIDYAAAAAPDDVTDPEAFDQAGPRLAAVARAFARSQLGG